MNKIRIPKWAKDAAFDYVTRTWPASGRSFKASQKKELAKTIAEHYSASILIKAYMKNLRSL